ncbi:16S rRNA processing protein RimM [Melghiribacillus thermohalophilus]|uniref:Ribosome maturation factor RimM n=1 Tax=Melghiribacillus thermohalophilus TaxID=1324956 RepID=A0A4R3NDT5_9BACI|nr:ribosome maturation factor RimM [Melghiribacillus thermohalophilus]TCT26795.1 16S rRNA processing protein RimM [Melghiribacillus thermohalophilus]
MEQKMFNVGKVVNTHGIKGEVKVVPITDFEERFTPGSKVYWVSEDERQIIHLEIDGWRKHKHFHLLHFKEYPSINDVEQLKGGMLKITEDQLTPLEEGEYYYHQIIGLNVMTQSGEEVGTIKEILSPGANDVWVVQRKGKKDALIPYIDDVVKKVSLQEKKVIIEPMEGLLD